MAGYETPANSGNQLRQADGWTYEYDDEGNRKKATKGNHEVTYGYDHHNRLTRMTTKTDNVVVREFVWRYDALGRRVEQSFDEDGVGAKAAWVRQYAYDGNRVSGTKLTTGEVIYEAFAYVPGEEAPVVRVSGKQSTWHLTDRQGTVVGVMGNGGWLAGEREYDGYGRIVRVTGTYPSWYGYAGRERAWDGVSAGEVVYCQARYYETGTGRWLSEDPIGFAAGDVNVYRYAGNNPSNHTDPNGMFTGWFGALVGAGIGFVVGAGSDLAVQMWNGREINWSSVFASGVGGAVSGAIVGAFAGAATGDPTALIASSIFWGVVSGGAGAFTTSVVRQALLEKEGVNFWTAGYEGAVGAVVGGLTGGVFGMFGAAASVFRSGLGPPGPSLALAGVGGGGAQAASQVGVRGLARTEIQLLMMAETAGVNGGNAAHQGNSTNDSTPTVNGENAVDQSQPGVVSQTRNGSRILLSRVEAPGASSLILGDGDFTFAAGLATRMEQAGTLSGRRLIVSNADDTINPSVLREVLARRREPVQTLRRMGIEPLTDVDATMLHHDQRIQTVDNMIWNQPFGLVPNVNHRSSFIRQNIVFQRDMLYDFFVSARTRLVQDGRIFVTLLRGRTGSIQLWNIEAQAHEAGFRASRPFNFDTAEFPGYSILNSAGRGRGGRTVNADEGVDLFIFGR